MQKLKKEAPLFILDNPTLIALKFKAIMRNTLASSLLQITVMEQNISHPRSLMRNRKINLSLLR